jgi:hypothetical protein
VTALMKQSLFRASTGRDGFIRTILVPVHERRDLRFGPVDLTMLVGIVFVGLLAARILVAH